jgi:hypothetical protein
MDVLGRKFNNEKMQSIAETVNKTHEDFGFSQVDAANTRANMKEMLVSMVILILMNLTTDDDDDDKNAYKKTNTNVLALYTTNLLFNQMSRMELDLQLYYNPIQLRSLVQGNVAASIKLIDDFVTLENAIRDTQKGGKSAIKRSGIDKGEYKLPIAIMDILPLLSQGRKIYKDTKRQIKKSRY